jgi:hypothetical protein
MMGACPDGGERGLGDNTQKAGKQRVSGGGDNSGVGGGESNRNARGDARYRMIASHFW